MLHLFAKEGETWRRHVFFVMISRDSSSLLTLKKFPHGDSLNLCRHGEDTCVRSWPNMSLEINLASLTMTTVLYITLWPKTFYYWDFFLLYLVGKEAEAKDLTPDEAYASQLFGTNMVSH